VFNTRRPYFADARVRKASALLFDFECVQQPAFPRLPIPRYDSFLFGQFELGPPAHPAKPSWALLEALGAISIARREYSALPTRPPVTDGSGIFANKCVNGLCPASGEAGWEIKA